MAEMDETQELDDENNDEDEEEDDENDYLLFPSSSSENNEAVDDDETDNPQGEFWTLLLDGTDEPPDVLVNVSGDQVTDDLAQVAIIDEPNTNQQPQMTDRMVAGFAWVFEVVVGMFI